MVCACRRFWRNMYHQFDRSMHPRQSILKTIHTLKETSLKSAQTLRALENVRPPRHLYTLSKRSPTSCLPPAWHRHTQTCPQCLKSVHSASGCPQGKPTGSSAKKVPRRDVCSGGQYIDLLWHQFLIGNDLALWIHRRASRFC